MQYNRNLLKNRNTNRSTVVALNGMVCASEPLATLAGLDMLRGGGNAIDAAIAANAMLGLVEPMSCGIGGDLFAIVWMERDRKLYGLNASGRSPYAWSLDDAAGMGIDRIPEFHPLAWNVPGCVSGWAALLERFGSRPLAELLSPAIDRAQSGFPVSEVNGSGWRFDTATFPTLGETYAPNGHAPRFGDVFTNRDLAASYTILAEQGPDAFYQGEIAHRIVAHAEVNGGRLALRDFADHTATWVDPVSTSYRGYDVWELPPNGQGIAALQMLNLLEHFDIGSRAPNSAEHLHLFVEAKKLAYEDRAVYYADPEKADVPLAWLISKDYAADRVKQIDPRRAAQRVMPGKSGGDTIYLTTADADGNMVSFIQSIYYGWGSHIVPGRLGFAMQNRGMSFSLDPKHRNRLEPHKRPFHTIIPAFVTQGGEPRFSFGVMGGDFQPQGHVQILMNLIDFGMSPQQAGDQPRAEHSGSSTPEGEAMEGNGIVTLEQGFTDGVARSLRGLGHSVADEHGVFGGYQGIWREENPRRYFGASECRKDGCALGY